MADETRNLTGPIRKITDGHVMRLSQSTQIYLK